MQCDIPGYTISGIAGVGGQGAVLRGRAETGQDVAVRVVPSGDAPQVRRAAERLLGKSMTGCAGPGECVEFSDGGLAVVSEFVEGPALATARAARRGFTAPECLQLGVEVLTALVGLHDLGHIHGDVSPANIILRPAGAGPGMQDQAEAVLVDLLHAPGQELGTPGFRAPEVAAGAPAAAAADVYALAQVCLWVAQPEARRDVAQQLEPLLATDPARRPSARAARELLQDKHRVAIFTPPHEALAAASLREQALRAPTTRVRGSGAGLLGAARRPGAGRRGRHRARARLGRTVLVGVLAACVLIGALSGGGLLSAESAQDPAAAPSSHLSADGALAAVVRDLVAGRDHALQAGDAQALAALTAPDSPLRHSDTELMRQLEQADVTLGDYRTEVSEIEVLSRQDGQARVQLVLRQLAHQRGGGHAEDHQVPAQDPHCLHLQLRRTAQRWVAVSAGECQ